MIERLRVQVMAGAAGEFSFPELTFCTIIRCPFHPVLLQWHIKDSSYSAKSANGRLHLNTHTPMTQQSRIG